MSLHPELAHLEQQYFALAEDLRLGHVSEADALQIMGNLSAVDGDGAVWSIDPYSGDFVRGFPGTSPHPADPGLFVPAQLPPVNTPVLPHGAPSTMVSEFQHPALRPLAPEPRSTRLRGALGGVLGGFVKIISRAFAGLGGLLKGRGRTVLVVIGFLFFAVLLVGRAPSAPDNEGGSGIGGDSTLPTTPVSVPDILLPGEKPAPQPPSAETLTALVTAFSSGDAAALAPFLPAEASARWTLAPVLGASRLGLPLSVAAPVVTGEQIRVELTVGDPAQPTARWTLTVDPQGRVLTAAPVAP